VTDVGLLSTPTEAGTSDVTTYQRVIWSNESGAPVLLKCNEKRRSFALRELG
jgi:hypothetical protein